MSSASAASRRAFNEPASPGEPEGEHDPERATIGWAGPGGRSPREGTCPVAIVAGLPETLGLREDRDDRPRAPRGCATALRRRFALEAALFVTRRPIEHAEERDPHPEAYWRNVRRAAWTFTNPPHAHWELDQNAPKLRRLAEAYERVPYATMRAWSESDVPRDDFALDYMQHRASLGWLALLCLAATQTLALAVRQRRRGWPVALRARLLALGVIAYVVLVSSLLEVGENHRIRFEVEPLLWFVIAASLAPQEKRAGFPRLVRDASGA